MSDPNVPDASAGAETPAGGSDPSAPAAPETPSGAPEDIGAETGGASDTPGKGDKAELSDDGSETPGDSGTPKDEGGEKGKKAKKRIGTLTRENYRLQQENERLKAEREKPVIPSEPKAEPRQEDFEDYDDFQKAHTKWTVDEGIRQNDVAKQKQSEKQTSEREAHERQIAFEDRADELRETMEDFDEVAKSAEMIRFYSEVPHLAEIVEGNEKGPEIAYFLGNNPDKAVELARLSPYQAAVEIGKLESKLSTNPKPRAASKAPDPINPTGGGGQGGAEKKPHEMNDAEFAKWRKGFIAKRNQ